jgi:hypothetical protein
MSDGNISQLHENVVNPRIYLKPLFTGAGCDSLAHMTTMPRPCEHVGCLALAVWIPANCPISCSSTACGKGKRYARKGNEAGDDNEQRHTLCTQTRSNISRLVPCTSALSSMATPFAWALGANAVTMLAASCDKSFGCSSSSCFPAARSRNGVSNDRKNNCDGNRAYDHAKRPACHGYWVKAQLRYGSYSRLQSS